MKMHSWVNFTNILRTTFLYESFAQSFFVLEVKVKLFIDAKKMALKNVGEIDSWKCNFRLPQNHFFWKFLIKCKGIYKIVIFTEIKGSSKNDVTQFWTFFTPLPPPRRHAFYCYGLSTIVTKSLTPKSLASFMDDPQKQNINTKSILPSSIVSI
jgi:hypothetical protein